MIQTMIPTVNTMYPVSTIHRQLTKDIFLLMNNYKEVYSPSKTLKAKMFINLHKYISTLSNFRDSIHIMNHENSSIIKETQNTINRLQKFTTKLININHKPTNRLKVNKWIKKRSQCRKSKHNITLDFISEKINNVTSQVTKPKSG